jgi:hypothetical protein
MKFHPTTRTLVPPCRTHPARNHSGPHARREEVDMRQSEAGSEFGTPSSRRSNPWPADNEPTRPPPDLVGPIFARRPDLAEFSLFLRGLSVMLGRVPKRTQLFGHSHKVIHSPASNSGTPVDSVPSRLQTLSDAGTPCFGLWNPEFVVIHRTLDPPSK